MTKVRINDPDLRWVLQNASHQVLFAEHPWRYTSPDAGRLYWAREWFKRLHPAMVAYAGQCQAKGVTPQPKQPEDLLLDATSQRASLLELKPLCQG